MRDYIPSVTGLRALSISIVIFTHLNEANSFGKIYNIPFPFTLITDGDFGVNIFFVISGFLITYLLLEEEKKNGAISLRNFYLRRVFRIFPAYYFLLLCYLILELFSVIHLNKNSWLSSIFYYKYLVPGDLETRHLWSLSVEEHFYVVWPIIFFLFRKSRVYFAFGIILLVFLCRLLAYYGSTPYPIIKNWTFIFQRVDAIMIGCLFAIYRTRISVWMEKVLSWKYVPFWLILLFLNTQYFINLNTFYKLHLGVFLVPLGIGSSVGTLTNLFIAIFLLFSINYKNGWFRILNSSTAIYIGKLSYSLYLWQQIFTISRSTGIPK